MSRQTSKRGVNPFWVTVLVGLLVVTLANLIPSPFVVQRPGPVVDVFGVIETAHGETPVIRVEGAEGYEPSGSLSVLSVTTSGNPDSTISWLQLIRPLFNPKQTIVPMSQLYPEGVTTEDRTEQNEALMAASQEAAIAAALRELGEPVESTVMLHQVYEHGPADGQLKVGDRILSVDGVSITSLAHLRSTVADRAPGEAVRIGVVRDGEELEVSIVPRAPEGGGDPLLGVSVSTEFEFELEVALELDQIGGPSAGLVFALGIYELLTQEDLTGGLKISGTGTIDGSGNVGPIGGLPEKLWGASEAGSDLVLMPLLNCEHLPSQLPDGLTIAPVANLNEALDVIRDTVAGNRPTGVERCTTG